MKVTSVDQVARSDVHNRLLRYLFASSDGIDAQYLTEEENEAIHDLQSIGLIDNLESGKLRANYQNRELTHVVERLVSLVPQGRTDADEFERLLVEHREIIGLLAFIQELTSTIIRSESVGDLFRAAFKRVSETVRFDFAVAVMLEQNLGVYLTRRKDYEKVVNERLVPKIRETLQAQIPVSFASTDVVIQADFSDLPASDSDGDPLAMEMHTILRQDNRTAGILVVYRKGPAFSLEEQRLLEILSSQVSMVLGNIRAHLQIQNLADTDDLTGIWNKRYFRRMLSSEVERSKIYTIPLSLMIFDVDNFKDINDRYGHPMGDVVLSELCGTVRESLRPPDTFARFGGDEFAIILPHSDLWGARAVADRILQRVRALEILSPEDGSRMDFSLSMGIATFVPPDMTGADLIQRADQRLYDAKKSGKNRYSW